MTDAAAVDIVDRNLLARFVKLARGFWSGSTKRSAWIWSGLFLACLLANTGLAVAVNRWSKYFFDALQNRDFPRLVDSLWLVIGLAIGTALVAAALVQARMRLGLRWRGWLTQNLTGRWLENRRFYQLSVLRSIDNPEARIAEDGRLSVDLLVDIAGGVINALLLSASFVVILWRVGGSLTVGGLVIPGYLVIAVVLYTALTSLGMYALGRPLVASVEVKAAGEGDFRYALTRTRENAETIALIGGEKDERKMLDASFAEVATRWLAVMRRQARMMFLANGNNVLAPAVPLLLGAPKYLSGELSLGDLMQAAAAFGQVQTALNWLADNALSLANWSASARRVAALDAAFEDLDLLTSEKDGKVIVIEESDDGAVHLVAVSISHHDGKIMLEESDARIEMGDKVIVKGDSGSGKSTLIRAVAGLWPWGSGQIRRPTKARFAFMPQRPYLPLGSLRIALAYPDDGGPVRNEEIAAVLDACGLEHLLPRLDEEDNWSGVLSGGEQQRLAFARIVLQKPDIVIMDEATSALDELSQKRMMELMNEKLPEAMVIHVAHRPGLERYHNREIVLKREKGGPASFKEMTPPVERVGKKLLTRFLKSRRAATLDNTKPTSDQD
jgi:putative ATP-binding cassette transporter